ncbi:hypothetical protein LDK12_03510 [Fusobacterium pseudoperiodonticum]|uniref:hypothetical protein n=1 Tax=Fusobacterium pseudoperiodonticum TaxID=2663009 RepID=UPI0030CF45D8
MDKKKKKILENMIKDYNEGEKEAKIINLYTGNSKSTKIINKENKILNDYNEGEKENITTFAAESLNAFSTKKEKK